MKIPVVLSTVHCHVGTDARLLVDLDGEPYGADRHLDRGDLPSVLDEITTALGTAVRVEVREADGTTYADIATRPELREAAREGHATDVFPPGITGAGFQPGEEVAIACIVARQTADAAGTTVLHLPPALAAARRRGLVLLGLTSHAVAAIE
jgi:hypothetical protein